MSVTIPISSLHERPAEFTADDGVALKGSWFEPATGQPAPTTAVVVACGAGIPARFYHRLARHLAERGAAVLTFDYRGVGASRAGKLRGMAAGMDDWAVRDLGAALATARSTFPDLPLSAVAHSVGALLLGAAPGAERLARCVFLGAHTGYWRDYHARWRVPLYVVWHAFMPAVTRAIGYFPGRALRLGEDLPRRVAYDWSGRRQPALIRNQHDARRFGPYMPRYAEVRAQTLAISVSDDAFAPPAAAERLLAMYPNLVVTREVVTPARLGRRRLGHFAFTRRGPGAHFWDRAAQWLLPQGTAAEEDPADRRTGTQPGG